MDKSARAAWVAEILAEHARTFQISNRTPKLPVSVTHEGNVEVYGVSPSGNWTTLAIRIDSSSTPAALKAFMEAARDVPYEGRRANEFLGVGILLDGTILIESYASANRDPVYFPEGIEKRVLAQFS